MAPKESVEDAMESHLTACAIFQPHPTKNDFELFRALQVELGDDGRAKFTPLGLGIDETFLKKYGLKEKIIAFRGFIRNAKSEATSAVTQQSQVASKALAGNVGVILPVGISTKASGGKSVMSEYNLTIKDTKGRRILQAGVDDFLKKCVPDFCNESDKIRAVFEEKKNRWLAKFEKVHYGLAFVTSFTTGSIVVNETYNTHVNGGADFGKGSTKIEAAVENDQKLTREVDSEGVIGIQVYFVHLKMLKDIKSNKGSVEIVSVFPVIDNNEKQLKSALKRINEKKRRTKLSKKSLKVDSTSVLFKIDSTTTSKDTKVDVMATVKDDGLALEHASEEMKADREVVLAAVKHNGMSLKFASIERKADREVVMAAVKEDGLALNYASKTMKADRKVVMAAVKHNGMALEHVSEEMRADREVVLAAVKHNGMSLEFASEEMQADREVISEAS